MSPRKKTKLERLLSFNQHRRRFGGSQNLSNIEDLTTLKNSIIQGTKRKYTHGSSKNLSEHLESLKDEFIGDSELCYVVAKTIVLIRRESKIKENYKTLETLLTKEGDFLLKNLNLRWLISISDTISEHSSCYENRALALCATILGNTVKIYETERYLEKNNHSKEDPERLRILQSERVPLMGGMSGFCIGTDDTLRNMRFRMNTVCEGNPIGKLLLEIFTRIQYEDTGYGRLKKRHTRSRTSWW